MNDKNGWLCETDAESIRAAIKSIAANPGKRKQMGNNARAFALDHYALDNIAAMEEQILINLINTAHSSKASKLI